MHKENVLSLLPESFKKERKNKALGMPGAGVTHVLCCIVLSCMHACYNSIVSVCAVRWPIVCCRNIQNVVTPGYPFLPLGSYACGRSDRSLSKCMASSGGPYLFMPAFDLPNTSPIAVPTASFYQLWYVPRMCSEHAVRH